ncbi:reverse transcriptase domain-containing protein [Tanacetum coccineum]|uniref:Reverse transcriptase domain-containing protein n=1 Tax=Tanacetum coccineum TaxID=301880 RepID=A0ABQ4WZB0_9ASTR
MKFAVIKALSPYNVILGRSGLKALRAIPSTIYSMMKFPTPKGIETLVTRSVIISECRRLEKKQMIEEKTTKFEKKEDEGIEEVSMTEEVLVNPAFLYQLTIIEGGLSKEYKSQLKLLLKNNMEKHRVLALEKSRAVTKEVAKWIKAGIFKPVWYPTWISNTVLVKKYDGSWRMCVDFKNLNLTCPKDYYPLPNIDWKCQTRRNLEAYVDDMVIKSNDEKMLLADIVEKFDNLRRINIKLNPKKCSFGVEEGKFLGYMVTSEGIRANPKKIRALASMQSPRTLKEMQSLSGKLAALNSFLAKSAERYLPFFNTLKNITKENKDEYRWTEEAEESFQQMKKLILDLPFLTTPLPKETLCAYLEISKEAVSAVLLTERKGKQCPFTMLRRYFEAHPVNVITDQPIKEVLSKTETSGKLAKYALELGAYNITYELRNDIKGQLLADFISQNSQCTNNEAKYEPLLAGLRIARMMKVESLEEKVDSKLVASQINGSYVASSNGMVKYLAKAKEHITCFKSFSIKNIPRNQNQKADERSTDAKDVNAVVEEVDDNWMTPIIKCLEEAIWPKDKNEAHCLRLEIHQYVMKDGVLFKKSYVLPMLRCVRPLQANYVIREIHMGCCGMHSSPRSVVVKAMRHGYYWSTMHKDAREEIQKCDSCQIHALVPKLPKTLMTSIMAPWPFYQWVMDILGPLPQAVGKVKFVIVAIDYFTKWIEAKSLAKITSK